MKQFLKTLHCFDIKNIQLLTNLGFILSIIGILISLQLFQLSEESIDAKFSTIILLNNIDRFVSRNDSVNMFNYLLNSGVPVQVDVSLLKQAYQTYLVAKGELSVISTKEEIEKRLSEVNSMEDYVNKTDYSVFETNEKGFSYMVQSTWKLIQKEQQLINTLIVTQILNILIAIYIAKKSFEEKR